MPKTRLSGGSSGIESAERVRTLFYHFRMLPSTQQTSASFNTMWAARSSRYLDIQCDYIIPGPYGNTSTGWFQYHRNALYLSTANTSSKSNTISFTLPSPASTELIARLAAMSTLGATDGAVGRHVFDLWSTSPIMRDSGYELFLSWAGRGLNSSAGIGSSVRAG